MRRAIEFSRGMENISGVGGGARLLGRGIDAVRRRLGFGRRRGQVRRVAPAPAEIYEGDAASGMFDLADLDRREARRRNANSRQLVVVPEL